MDLLYLMRDNVTFKAEKVFVSSGVWLYGLAFCAPTYKCRVKILSLCNPWTFVPFVVAEPKFCLAGDVFLFTRC
jgi:hypothetical protein